jgi:hypothetical protein
MVPAPAPVQSIARDGLRMPFHSVCCARDTSGRQKTVKNRTTNERLRITNFSFKWEVEEGSSPSKLGQKTTN